MSKRNKSLFMILGAIFLGALIGGLLGKEASLFGITFYSFFDLVGTLFLHALTMVVVPLVASSIISGVAKMAQDHSFGRLGLKTFFFYLLTTLCAVVIGVTVVNIIKPGTSVNISSLNLAEHKETAANASQMLEGDNIKSIILEIIPPNIVEALGKGQMLGVIFFSLLFGYAISKTESQHSSQLVGVIGAIFNTMIQVTHLVLKCLPIGVFCLVAETFATFGFDSLKSLALFFVTALTALAIFAGVVLPLLLKYIANVNPLRHVRAMGPAIATAFSTSSSSATLPVTMDCVEKRAHVSNKVCSLVIPLGTSMNMSGSALYECVAALFVAQAFGLKISILTQIIVGFLALITSLGVAGIPAGSLVCVIVILKTLGLPPEGIGLFLAVDRILDMCRTTVNVFSDSCCAVLVARSEGESQVLQSENFENKK
jgi:proton glutamate symport protein